MNKPENFISTTDYSTLQNDDDGIADLTIPGSIVVPNAGVYLQSQDFQIGAAERVMRIKISTTRQTGRWYVGSWLRVTAPGTSSIAGAGDFPIFISVYRVNETTVRVSAALYNAYPGILTMSPLAIYVAAKINTFIPPSD